MKITLGLHLTERNKMIEKAMKQLEGALGENFTKVMTFESLSYRGSKT